MRFDLSSQNTKILQEQKKHRQWMVAFLVLSVTVVLGTAAALKLYGQALTHKVKVLDCQVKAHEHTDECYVYDEKKGEDVPVCGYADYLVHVHNDDCYDENGRLVCPLEEIKPHKHTDECYEEQQVLICGLEGIEPAQGADTGAAGTTGSQPGQTPGGGAESQPVKTTEAENQPEQTSGAQSQPTQEATTEAPSTEAPTTEAPTAAASAKAQAETESKLVCVEKEHTHTDVCYGEAALSCGLEEHKHGDDCYETTLTCDAPEHAHESSCYDENGEPVCGFEEHEHGDACYEKTLTCMKEEHEHEDACYGERELTCKEKEHTHTDACYAEVAVETKAPAETKAPETKAPETKAPETKAAETTAAPTTAAPETTTAAGEGVHVHTDACYETKLVPVCGKLELHTHDEDCYDEDGKLICELPQLEEHVHDKDCFKTVELTDEEIAALNAGVKLHIHHEDCYDENGELICGHNETHIHGEKCYDRDGKLICGHDEAHVHTPDCYDKNGDIICGLEVVVHEHTDACYDENGKLICDHAHIHEESCFDEEGNMTCDFEDVGDYLWTCENEEENYIVTAKFNYEAKIPGNAKLIAEQIKPEGDDEEYFAQREKEYREAMQDETADMRALMRIGFYVENKDAKNEKDKLTEIEPEAPVTITVQFLDDDGLADGEPITVVHFGKEGTELLDGGQAEDNSTTFEMKGFSDIAIGYGDEGAKASVSRNAVDESADGSEVKEKEPETIHLDDSFEYEDEAFHITFHVKGKAVLPENVKLENQEEKKEETNVTGPTKEVVEPEGEEGKEGTNSEEEKKEEINEEELKKSESDTDTETTEASETEETTSAKEMTEAKATEKEKESKQSETAEKETELKEAETIEKEKESTEAETTEKETESKKAESDAAEISAQEESKKNEESGEAETTKAGTDADEENDGAQEGTTVVTGTQDQKLALNVETLDEDSKEYRILSEYANEMGELDELLQMQLLTYSVSVGNAELDLSNCEVTVEVSTSEEFQKRIEQSVLEAASYLADDKREDAFQINEAEEDGISTKNNGLIEMKKDSISDNEKTKVYGDVETDIEDNIDIEDTTEIQIAVAELEDNGKINEVENMVLSEETRQETMRFSMRSNTFVLRSTEVGKANPEFKVEYYANLPLVVRENGTGTQLSVINTSNGKNSTNGGAGGALPQNGKGLNTSPTGKTLQNIYLNSSGIVQTKEQQTQVYATKTFEYKNAPSLKYFDCLTENAGYTLNAIWVKYVKDPSTEEDGFKPSNKTPENGWYKYTKTELENLHFTNRKVTAVRDQKYVYINQGVTIRLIYDTVDKNENPFDAAFYDYNITGGKTNNIWNTAQKGINIAGNYKGSGAKYAFGNANTGTGLEEQKWKGNKINKYNSISKGADKDSYQGCVFGLVSSVDKNGNIVFASGINGLKIFGSDALNGKDIYKGSSLNFKRNGDTYTLTSATVKDEKGTIVSSVSNLDQFKPWTNKDNGVSWTFKIWSNNFWPLDGRTGAADPKFGKLGTTVNRTGGAFPVSDDGIAHNSYFGMHYTVKFNLDKDYVGPLQYLFFGDDDMWVFLDGKLICDLGGVHSSVGEYVNLWDWLGADAKGKEHTLQFFYTERGASGSSCWMQFTLPSVTSVPLEQNTGTLEVSKAVSYEDSDDEVITDEEFTFNIKFTREDGKTELLDDFSYVKYNAKGEEIGRDIILWSGSDFTLKKGEKIVIKYLPIGTKYTISEKENPLYEPKYSISQVKAGGSSSINPETKSGTVKGNITEMGVEYQVAYNNIRIVYALPETGGPGPEIYTMAGAICLMFGAGLMYRKKYRGRRV